MAISVPFLKHLRLFSIDVGQAYIQSEEHLQREVFVNPCKEFGFEKEKILKLKIPLYALAESEDYWGWTLRKHLKGDLNVVQCTLDLAVYYKHKSVKLLNLCVTYVDYTLHAENTIYEELLEKPKKKLNCKNRSWDRSTLACKLKLLAEIEVL